MGKIRTGEKTTRAREIADKYNVSLSTARYWVGLNLTESEMKKRRQRSRRSKCNEIEGVPIEELAEQTGFSIYSLKDFARRKITLRQVYFRAQVKDMVPMDLRVYCDRPVMELAEEFDVPLNAITRMAKLGLKIEEMPAFIEEHKDTIRKKNGRAMRGETPVKQDKSGIKRQNVADINRKMLAMKL